MDSSCVNVCQWVTHNTKVIKKSDLFNNFGADMDHWVRQTVVGLQVAELCIWVSWLQPGGRITEIWRTRVKYAVEKLQRPQPDFLWISFSVSSPTPRVPLTKFRSIRRELTDSGRKVEELLADTPSLKYNFGFPASGAPTPETLKNYLDVSSSRTCLKHSPVLCPPPQTAEPWSWSGPCPAFSRESSQPQQEIRLSWLPA